MDRERWAGWDGGREGERRRTVRRIPQSIEPHHNRINRGRLLPSSIVMRPQKDAPAPDGEDDDVLFTADCYLANSLAHILMRLWDRTRAARDGRTETKRGKIQ